MSLMFPGFRGEALVRSEDLPETTRRRMNSVQARLKAEICKSYGSSTSAAEIAPKAEDIVTAFMSHLPELRKIIWKDIDAALRRRSWRRGVTKKSFWLIPRLKPSPFNEWHTRSTRKISPSSRG